MSNAIPILPIPLTEDDDAATREVDGEAAIDDDANENLVNSADADELASQEPQDDR